MRKFYLFIIVILCFVGCTRESTTIQIIRNPVIEFLTDSASWQADDYSISQPSKVVEYPANAGTGRLYNRFTLNAFGKDSRGRNLQLIIVFDAVDATRLTGIYSPVYSLTSGLKDIQIFNLENNNLASYSLCGSNAQFRIVKQSTRERLVAGIFNATVCNVRDTTNKINITNGVFTDIRY